MDLSQEEKELIEELKARPELRRFLRELVKIKDDDIALEAVGAYMEELELSEDSEKAKAACNKVLISNGRKPVTV